MGLKKQFIKDFHPELKVNTYFICHDMKVRDSKNGDRFADITLRDKTGEINMKIWNFQQSFVPWLQIGSIVFLSGANVKEYNGAMQITIDSNSLRDMVKECNENEFDIMTLIQATDEDLEQLLKEIKESIASIKSESVKCLMRLIFEDSEFINKFKIWPAAIKHHHAYAGGLIEHTVCVMRLCLSAANNYETVDRDYLIAGALLHDLGKMRSYTYDLSRGSISMSKEGLLSEHLMLSIDILLDYVSKLKNCCPRSAMGCICVTDEQLGVLKHLILSHHGSLEWGSPVQPATIEACILHHADNMDAQVHKFNKALKETRGTASEGIKFVDVLGRSIYLGNSKEESVIKNNGELF